MRSSVILRCFGLGAALTLGALGCADEESENPAPETATPAFPENSGQAANPAIAYPAGPYGIRVGSIAPDFAWVGFQNPSIKNDVMQIIRLSDFYNPHATDATYVPVDAAHDDRLYTSELYGVGTPKPKVVTIDVASVWCGPCNLEAKTTLPPLHSKYKPLGGEFLLNLGDGRTQNIAATPKDLLNWTKQYKVDFPAMIDPDYKLGEFFAQGAWPANMIIDTRTMKIVKVIAGVPDSAYWKKYEQILNAN